jgi:hypothetical protein
MTLQLTKTEDHYTLPLNKTFVITEPLQVIKDKYIKISNADIFKEIEAFEQEILELCEKQSEEWFQTQLDMEEIENLFISGLKHHSRYISIDNYDAFAQIPAGLITSFTLKCQCVNLWNDAFKLVWKLDTVEIQLP